MKEMAMRAMETGDERSEALEKESNKGTNRMNGKFKAFPLGQGDKLRLKGGAFEEDVRLETLATSLIDRLRPFVEAQASEEAGEDESEIIAFESDVVWEAKELKSIDFGADLLRLIGEVYFTAASIFLSSKKMMGM
jgi:hypothetical protein